MRITYLNNSGFAIEKDSSLIVIDCFDPLEHEMLSDLSSYETVTFLASHFHADHFSPDIRKVAPKDASIVLSFDIKPRQNDVSLKVGKEVTLNGVTIHAFGSTDEGISFYITWEDGTSLFHAGDLNNWHWRDEGGEDYATKAQNAFLKELSKITDHVGCTKLDFALFPVDPRIGSDYYRGAVQFCEALRPKVLIPMHFRETTKLSDAFFDEVKPYALEVCMPTSKSATVYDSEQ